MLGRLGALCFIPICLGLSANASAVWVITHPHGGGTIDTVGSISVGFASSWTTLTEWSADGQPKKLGELALGGLNADAVAIKSDKSEVAAHVTDGPQKGKWVVYNFKEMEKSSRITILNPPPDFEAVDVRYVDDHATMLCRKGDSAFEAYTLTDEGKWHRVFASYNGDLSGLNGFPYASMASQALSIASSLSFVDPVKPARANFKWWEFFGGRGSSELGAFDPKSGIVVVRSKWDGNALTLARATPNGPLAAIRIEPPVSIGQIYVIDGITYVAKGNEILGFDLSGKQVCRLYGELLAGG
ncbi:MAG: hypothetical protein ACHQ50_11815 [Fimbriimonadales bacterium]